METNQGKLNDFLFLYFLLHTAIHTNTQIHINQHLCIEFERKIRKFTKKKPDIYRNPSKFHFS